MNITVFCASAEKIDEVFFEETRKLGKAIGERGWNLVYGGTNMGLMREVAGSVAVNGGSVTGIIPECILERGVAAKDIDRLIVAKDMKERKQLLRDHADAFVALPGGWGTLEEITEVITLKQLGRHSKPVIFLNIKGFYDDFLKFIDRISHEGFISSAYKDVYYVADTIEDMMGYLDSYVPREAVSKY